MAFGNGGHFVPSPYFVLREDAVGQHCADVFGIGLGIAAKQCSEIEFVVVVGLDLIGAETLIVHLFLKLLTQGQEHGLNEHNKGVFHRRTPGTGLVGVAYQVGTYAEELVDVVVGLFKELNELRLGITSRDGGVGRFGANGGQAATAVLATTQGIEERLFIGFGALLAFD